MSIVAESAFVLPLGADAALLPRTPAITDAYHELLVANQQRLARWERWAAQPPTVAGTRSFLERSAHGWIDGTQLPTAIAVAGDDGWHLVGSAGLRVDGYTQSAQAGYWIDAGHEGQGLVTRAMTALLEYAFGPLRLHRVGLRVDVSNVRSRAVAARLGFAEEGILRQAIAVQGVWRDDVVFGLLAEGWQTRRSGGRR